MYVAWSPGKQLVHFRFMRSKCNQQKSGKANTAVSKMAGDDFGLQRLLTVLILRKLTTQKKHGCSTFYNLSADMKMLEKTGDSGDPNLKKKILRKTGYLMCLKNVMLPTNIYLKSVYYYFLSNLTFLISFIKFF